MTFIITFIYSNIYSHDPQTFINIQAGTKEMCILNQSTIQSITQAVNPQVLQWEQKVLLFCYSSTQRSVIDSKCLQAGEYLCIHC